MEATVGVRCTRKVSRGPRCGGELLRMKPMVYSSPKRSCTRFQRAVACPILDVLTYFNSLDGSSSAFRSPEVYGGGA